MELSEKPSCATEVQKVFDTSIGTLGDAITLWEGLDYRIWERRWVIKTIFGWNFMIGREK